MNKLFVSVLLVLVVSAGEVAGADLVFRIRPAFRAEMEDSRSDLRKYFQSLGLLPQRRFPRHVPPDRTLLSKGFPAPDLSLLYGMVVPDPACTAFTLRQVSRRPEVQWAEWEENAARPLFMPGDPGADSTAGQQRLVLKRIEAYAAWNLSRGDTSVLVGILDTGTPVLHEDLQTQIVRFSSDPPNGIDDDNNGYTDDYRGWDFGSNDNDPSPDNTGTAPGHGTSVASIAGAAFDNGLGVAGIAGKCRILPVKIWRWNNGFSNFRGYDALVYAADRGCRVINCSWGSARNNRQFEQDIIDYVTLVKGCLVVASGGNTPGSFNFLPANYDRVTGVSMTDENDQIFWAASTNPRLDLMAPGVNVWAIRTDGSYGWVEGGTSMSAPMVAGAAGLVLARYPELTGLQAGELLRVNSDTVYHLSPSNAGYRDATGRGRLNIRKALERLQRVSLRPVRLVVRGAEGLAARAGDTLEIRADFENYLDSVPSFSARLVPMSPEITVLQATLTEPGMGSLTARRSSQAFRIVLSPAISGSPELGVRIETNAGDYRDRQLFTIRVTGSWVDLDANQVRLSVASNGRLGFADGDNTLGSGILYKGIQNCGDAGWMIGTGPAQVSNCVYDTLDTDLHFRSENRVAFRNWPGLTQHTVQHFNDSAAGAARIGIRAKQSVFELDADSLAGTVFLSLQLRNLRSDTLDSLCVAMYNDWETENPNRNFSAWSDSLRMGYTWGQAFRRRYAATQILSPGEPQFFAITALPDTAGGNINLFDGFSLAEKWKTMSRGVARPLAGTGSGNNVVQVTGVKLRNLQPGETRRVTMAFVFADSLGQLLRRARAGSEWFRKLQTSPSPPAQSFTVCRGDTLNGAFSFPGQFGRMALFADSLASLPVVAGSQPAYSVWSDSLIFIQGLDSLFPGPRSRQAFRVAPLPPSGFTVAGNLPGDTLLQGSLITFLAEDGQGNRQWYRNDSLLTDSTSGALVLNASSAGPLKICLEVTDSQGCQSRTCRTFWVKETTRSKGLVGRPGARIFPNPAGNRVGVQPAGPVIFRLRDPTGRELISGTGESHIFYIELSHLPDGIYSLLLEGQIRNEVIRLVKQTGGK